MECKTCDSKMVEDELFKSGAVTMLFGNPSKDGIHRETRMVCPNKCSVEYVKIN